MKNTIASYLRMTAEKYPNKIAFRDSNGSITFEELDRRARKVAYEINMRLKGRTNQPIGIYLPKGIECVVAFLGVVYSGNYYTPLDVLLPKKRRDLILDALKPVMIISDSNICDGMLPYDVFMLDLLERDEVSDDFLDDILRKVIDSDVLYVMFTSGSTGNPKGVTMTHRAVMDFVDWISETFDFDEETVFGNQVPFCFDISVSDIYCTLRNGCETVIIPEEKFLSGTKLLQFLEEKDVNTVFWVPSAMAVVANAKAFESVSAKQIKKVLFAGEVMPVKQMNVWRRYLPEATFANLYGPTEVAVIGTYYIIEREFADAESLPIGIPCRNVGALVLDENDREVSKFDVGELCIRGTCLAQGYYRNVDKTEEVFIQNPLNDAYPELIYRTGDLVRYNDAGELLYVGRKDFQIKHSGYRIELGEIETAALAIQEVDSCCVLYDEEEKRIVMFVTPDTLDKKGIYAKLKEALPHYMLPKLIITEKALLLNRNGKIDRAELKKKMKG